MDGWKAVAIGLAAKKSALSGQVIDLSNIENYPI
jgi:hypothetical protein|tara:strand:- start:167 stop:268 length:102 start_codon:yes stop_codon:yes gene_type:complete